MEADGLHARRSASFWLLVLGATVFLTIEPALCLVVLALALSALALTWILMLARLLLFDAFAELQRARHVHASVERNERTVE